MTEDIVERVAEAMTRAAIMRWVESDIGPRPDPPELEEYIKEQVPHRLGDARAAIRETLLALREPSEWMASCGGGVLYHGHGFHDARSDPAAVQVWTAMIDAALK